MKTTLRFTALMFADLLAATALGAAPSAPAASEAEQLRAELRALKEDYARRVGAIEERLNRLEPAAVAVEGRARPPGAPEQEPGVAGKAAAPAVASTVLAVEDSAVRARAFAEQEFRGDTESRDRAVLTAEHPWAGRVEQVLQGYLDTKGYFRAGYGRNDRGGPQVGFQAPGAFAKYRLGNEPENYGEITFGKNFYTADAFKPGAPGTDAAAVGPIARFQTTLSIFNPYQNVLSSSGTDFGLPEAWASIGNVVAAQPSMKFWAGSRYYRRHDIHVNDFMYSNMSGSGGGVEDIAAPLGRLAFAWIGGGSTSGISSLPEPDAANQAGFSKGNWDVRLYDVAMLGGKGEFGLTYARADSGLDAQGHSAPDSDGVAFTFVHTREQMISADGVNKLSVQYGTGAAKTFTSGFETFAQDGGVFIRPDDRDSWRFRVTEHFTANVSDAFSIGPAFVYQVTDYHDGGGQVQWASAGVRPIWHFNSYVSLAAEAGVDWVRDEGAGTSDRLYKLTLAPQVSLGGRFMSRPVLRGFVTYASWGDDFAGQVGGNDYRLENSGLTYGVQMETWW